MVATRRRRTAGAAEGWRVLVCAALAALVVLLPAAASAATFDVEGDRLVVSGHLYGDRDFERFSAVLRAHPEVTTVRMKNFFGGIRMSVFLLYPKVIRERGLATEVDGPCISACALMFLGGVQRRLAPGANPKRSFIGLHAVSRAGKKVDAWEKTYINALKRFTGGKFTDEIAKRAFDVPSDSFLAFFDTKALPAGAPPAMLCEVEGGKLDCDKVEDLDGYRLGIFTP